MAKVTTEEQAKRRDEAMSRLLREPWIDAEDFIAIEGVSTRTGYQELNEGRVKGAYRVGKQFRIPSVFLRKRLGLTGREAA